MIDFSPIRLALSGVCPRCQEGRIFKSILSLDLQDQCPVCQLDLRKNDTADGPAVFLIFIFGFALVPLALLLAHWVPGMALWAHGLLWGVVLLAVTFGSLKPVKAYIIALQYKYRPGDFE